jgi:hypothetical protein
MERNVCSFFLCSFFSSASQYYRFALGLFPEVSGQAQVDPTRNTAYMGKDIT